MLKVCILLKLSVDYRVLMKLTSKCDNSITKTCRLQTNNMIITHIQPPPYPPLPARSPQIPIIYTNTTDIVCPTSTRLLFSAV